MSIQKKTRNMQEGWCPEGVALRTALDRDSHAASEIAERFSGQPSEEIRAAVMLWAFTGHEPYVEDDQRGGGQARNNAVDVMLRPSDAPPQVVEVTQTLDPRYEDASAAGEKLERAVSAQYSGSFTWFLEFERGWELQPLRKLAPLIARRLNAATEEEAAFEGGVWVNELVRAYGVGRLDDPRIVVTGRNAGADNLEIPYLDALSKYLRQNEVIGNKLTKLRHDAALYRAARTHLFLHIASTGRHGGLLPVSPSYFTWGTFDPPTGVTDIWLDSAVSTLYHWTREGGWVFHDLAP